MTSICWRQQNDLKLRGIEIEKFFPDFSSSQKNLKFFKFFSWIHPIQKKIGKKNQGIDTNIGGQ
jgi:hypothetical protein